MHNVNTSHNDPNSTLNNMLKIDPNYLGHQYPNCTITTATWVPSLRSGTVRFAPMFVSEHLLK